MRQEVMAIAGIGVIGLMCMVVVNNLDPDAVSDRVAEPFKQPVGPRSSQEPMRQHMIWRREIRADASETIAPLARTLLDELSHQQDDAELERRWRLSQFFKQWGSLDVDGALQFLEQEESANRGEPHSPIEALAPMAILGHTHRNAADAWQRLDVLANEWADSRQEAFVPEYVRPTVTQRVAEEIFTEWWSGAEKAAEEWLFTHGKESVLSQSVLNALLKRQLAQDDVERLIERYRDEVEGQIGLQTLVTLANSYDYETALKYAGPEFGGISSFDPTILLRLFWAQIDPINAFEYVTSGESMAERKVRFGPWAMGAMFSDPAKVLSAMRSGEFSSWQQEFDPKEFVDTCMGYSRAYYWPLNDREYRSRLQSTMLKDMRHELGHEDFPPEMRESFLKAIADAEAVREGEDDE